MVERLKKVPEDLLVKWKGLPSKRRTAVISAFATIVLAVIILVYFASKTEYEQLIVGESTKDISSVASLLESEGIEYKLGDDNLSLYVDSARYSDAVLLVYSSDVPTSGLSLDELLDNGLNTTNSERNLKNHLYIQNEIRKNLIKMKGITDAQVTYVPQDKSYSILSEKKDYPASVALTIDSSFNIASARGVAEYVAAAIGNESTDKIKIVDQYGNLLFGGQDDLYSSNVSSIIDYREKLQNTYNNNIYILMMNLGFDDVQSMFNWSLNMDKVTELYTEQIPAEGQEQGLYKNYYSYDSENTSSEAGGVPGTDNNDDTSYVIGQGSNNSGSNVKTVQIEYLPSERVTNTVYEVGAVIPEESSGSIVATKVVTYREEDLKNQGLLNNMTFDEFVNLNSDRKQMEVSDDIYKLVSLATGVPQDQIQIIAYEQPVFIPIESKVFNWDTFLQILLLILIIALLLFIVFKGSKPVEVMETEPEISVEELLASTNEQKLEDIDLSEKSETKRIIEKLVDEDPESVAKLLRNWLNEEEWD